MSELDRREFIAFVGKACAGMAATRGLVNDESAEALAAPAQGGERVIYRGANLRQIAMPMGGLGAGNVALSGGGSLRNWQIFNQCNPQAQLQGTFFALWAKPEGGEAVARLLQTEPLGKLPTIQDVEFSGEYPFAWIAYKDSALPVQARMEAYCPLIPLNAKDSGIPGVVFRFTVKNPGAKAVAVSLVQTCRNAVGFDGFGSFDEAFRNRNDYAFHDGLHTLHLTTGEGGAGAALDQAVILLTESRQVARMARCFYNADLRFYPSLASAPNELKPTATALLAAERGSPPPNARLRRNAVFERPDAPVVALVDDLEPARNFTALEEFVAQGGSLVVMGGGRSLLEGAISENEDKTAILYDDFEKAKYDPAKWTVEGDAFGDGPARGTLPGQQAVSGFGGGGLINTFLNGDNTTGKMTSKPFKIERRYIHFLIGGGNHPGETCINLRIGRRIVRTATGRNEERLRPEKWDVGEFIGKEGILEIVDARQDGWGHINIDNIVFSDRFNPPQALAPETRQKIRDFLPFTFTALQESPDRPLPDGKGAIRGAFNLFGFRPKQGVQNLDIFTNKADEPMRVAWRHGQGRVVMNLGFQGESYRQGWYPANEYRQEIGNRIEQATGLKFTVPNSLATTHPFYGSMAIATNSKGAGTVRHWDDLAEFWQAFAATGEPNGSPLADPTPPPGKTWNGALAAPFTLLPGEEKEVVFYLGWRFPNRYRDRSYDVGFGSQVTEYEVKYRLGNQYNNWFPNAAEVVAYLHANDARLHKETHLFHDTFYDSTLPYVVRDAISSQVSILRSQTSMWLEDGKWMAYEGLGCCPMNCTHVYNYAQALAKLFPELERDARRTDLTVQLKPDGGVRHRVQLPLYAPRVTDPFVDGHLSTICKAYREHLQSADKSFLREFWPAIKQATEFALRAYDPNGDGLVEVEQWNTYDCAVYGPNSFISTQFLAALRAAEEMAIEMGDKEVARTCRAVFEKGKRNLDTVCWNGEYYQQVFDAYLTTPTQYGPGCHADQVLGQWWAHVLNLGYLAPPERIHTALKSLMKHNFIADFTGWNYHGQRVFADGKDAGLVCCTWPKGGRPEKVPPILYCDEVWTGVEYQVAAHLLYEGMTEEALKIVTALRARYDGRKRNPWNEIECSDHYGRAMASWSVLLAASGYHYHGPKGILGFAPRLTPEDFRAFFTTAQGWGNFGQKRAATTQENRLRLAYGTATLNELHLALPDAAQKAKVTATATVGNKRVPATVTMPKGSATAQLAFSNLLTLHAGETLTVLLKWA